MTISFDNVYESASQRYIYFKVFDSINGFKVWGGKIV
jgi:hypothetical protein